MPDKGLTDLPRKLQIKRNANFASDWHGGA